MQAVYLSKYCTDLSIQASFNKPCVPLNTERNNMHYRCVIHAWCSESRNRIELGAWTCQKLKLCIEILCPSHRDILKVFDRESTNSVAELSADMCTAPEVIEWTVHWLIHQCWSLLIFQQFSVGCGLQSWIQCTHNYILKNSVQRGITAINCFNYWYQITLQQ